MKILGLDSSGLVASVAVVEDDCLQAEFTVDYKKTHSQTLLPMLEQVRQLIELDLDTVDAIAVAAGPGSFTGLRIGSATAKGLGLAMEKPIVEVPTLEGLAYNLCGVQSLVCPLMDARRGQVYTGIYTFRPQGPGWELVTMEAQCAVAIPVIVEKLNHLGQEVIFLGDGVPVAKQQLDATLKVPYRFAPAHKNRQSAASVAALGAVYYAQGKTVPATAHQPIYLRLSQAERERLEQEQAEQERMAQGQAMESRISSEETTQDKLQQAEAVQENGKGGVLHMSSGEPLVCIRSLRAEDVPAVHQLETECFSEPWSEAALYGVLYDGVSHFLVAECDGKVVGSCGVMHLLGEGDISNVAVTAHFRGRGIAYAMLSELLRRSEEAGITDFTLEVRASNTPAIRLYEKLGFVSEGIRPHFYTKPTEDALIMWRRHSPTISTGF